MPITYSVHSFIFIYIVMFIYLGIFSGVLVGVTHAVVKYYESEDDTIFFDKKREVRGARKLRKMFGIICLASVATTVLLTLCYHV